MGNPREVAKVLCFLLTDDASYVTGGTLSRSTVNSWIRLITDVQHTGRLMVGTVRVKLVLVGNLVVANLIIVKKRHIKMKQLYFLHTVCQRSLL
jgi:NAD(P)-dependent dehydrogenase (short-subunit alcohol dehydrogenase family)